MNPTLSIRFAEVDDLNTVGYLAQQIWPQTYRDILSPEQLGYMMNLFYSPNSLKKQLQEQKHIFLIAEQEEEPVGFASYASTADQGIYKLHKIYVLPSQQGKGLGKAMIDFIVDHIQPMGATALLLNVNRHNKARHFYEKLGFRVIREEDIDIGHHYFMNDYVLELKIG